MTELSELDDVKTGIYIIEDESGNPDETFAAFSRYKETKERACAKPVKSDVRRIFHHRCEETNRAAYGAWQQGHLCAPFEPLVQGEIEDHGEAIRRRWRCVANHRRRSFATLKPAFGKQGGNNVSAH